MQVTILSSPFADAKSKSKTILAPYRVAPAFIKAEFPEDTSMGSTIADDDESENEDMNYEEDEELAKDYMAFWVAVLWFVANWGVSALVPPIPSTDSDRIKQWENATRSSLDNAMARICKADAHSCHHNMYHIRVAGILRECKVDPVFFTHALVAIKQELDPMVQSRENREGRMICFDTRIILDFINHTAPTILEGNDGTEFARMWQMEEKKVNLRSDGGWKKVFMMEMNAKMKTDFHCMGLLMSMVGNYGNILDMREHTLFKDSSLNERLVNELTAFIDAGDFSTERRAGMVMHEKNIIALTIVYALVGNTQQLDSRFSHRELANLLRGFLLFSQDVMAD